MLGIDSVNMTAGSQQSYIQGSASQVSATSNVSGDAPQIAGNKEKMITVLEKKNISEENFQQKVFSEKQLIDAVEQGNRELKKLDTNLRFSIHEKTKKILVKVVDSQTNEVIREIPPEKLLDMCAFMMEKAGLLVDKRG